MPFKRKANEIRDRDTPRGRLCEDKGRIDWTDAPVSQRKTTPAREELYMLPEGTKPWVSYFIMVTE